MPVTPTPITRLLIANRGEIACRIALTARAMGVETVGVVSEADRTSRHVTEVDLAVALGGTSPGESYLRADKVLEAAIRTGCDAVHPGYGFLAENADFARAVGDAGLVWVGPSPEQIALLGDKVAAKEAAIAAGVDSTPSVVVAPGDPAPELSFPLLVKAAAGGGGRGMRVVERPEDFADAVVSAAREAEAAFGDGTVFVEPFVASGRHVEVQILGDHHGTVLVLGDRDCSVQRRNQKVLEEAPAPDLAPEVREQLHRSAHALAAHVGYRNAGTVEFLVGPDGTVVFLEVNTRLQVEHPVTEAVTGLDLVELQLRVASGEPLALGQDDVVLNGHAIEARVVAESPSLGWLPQTGTIQALGLPDGVRVDHGLVESMVIGAHYDSLLAKVIAHGKDRETARRRLAAALDRLELVGIVTNRAQLSATVRSAAFADGARLSTRLLDDHPELADAELGDDEERDAHLVAVALAERALTHRGGPVDFAPAGWRNLRVRGERSRWDGPIGETSIELHAPMAADGTTDGAVQVGDVPEPDEHGALAIDERPIRTLRACVGTRGVVDVELDGILRRVRVRSLGDGSFSVTSPSLATAWRPVPRFVVPDRSGTGSGPVSPLPGTVLSVSVQEGDLIEGDQVLVVVEAMKMEHVIKASGPARVVCVNVAAGDRVDAGDLLVELEAQSDAG